MAPNQSDPTSIGLTSGRVIPLKNLPYSCKYSTGETLKCIAVVLTVKVSYVASTKYRKTGEQAASAPVVVWRMKAPEKLPLVRREPEEEVRAKVRRASGPRIASPLQMLSSFEGPAQPEF